MAFGALVFLASISLCSSMVFEIETPRLDILLHPEQIGRRIFIAIVTTLHKCCSNDSDNDVVRCFHKPYYGPRRIGIILPKVFKITIGWELRSSKL